MAQDRTGKEEAPSVRVIFGGGMDTRRLEQDIQDRECSDGHDFHLDLESASYSNRKPFDLVGTAPNGGSINGYAQLLNSDGSTTQIVQAGSNVYKWDGTASGFTLVGTCPSTSRLRGKLEANFSALSKVIITDLSLMQPVMTWDGTSFVPLATNLGTTFFAKYCQVELQRAFFANVAAGTPTPHMLVASKLGDPSTLSIANQPSSALGTGDPFYILTPNMSPIVGMPDAPSTRVLATQMGAVYAFAGDNSQNFGLTGLYPQASVAGDEAAVYIENDLAYGRNGRIESLFGVQSYGNVEAAELSRPIANQIGDVIGWTLVYDRRLYRLYCFPQGKQEVRVLHKSINDGAVQQGGKYDYGLSPWSKWTTAHAIAFQPTCAWTMKRPSDGLFMVYMGDQFGNIYQLEGSGGMDGGTAPLTVERVSKLYGWPDGIVYDVTGFVHYRQLFAVDLALQFEWAGSEQFDQPLTVNLTPSAASAVYGGTAGQSNAAYFGGSVAGNNASYYGQRFARRFTRRPFDAAGRSSHFRVRATVTGAVDFAIDEIVIDVVGRQA